MFFPFLVLPPDYPWRVLGCIGFNIGVMSWFIWFLRLRVYVPLFGFLVSRPALFVKVF